MLVRQKKLKDAGLDNNFRRDLAQFNLLSGTITVCHNIDDSRLGHNDALKAKKKKLNIKSRAWPEIIIRATYPIQSPASFP